ncbi:MAG TPA: 23S rRNA (uracil(1939)-C(5))-methyltransferase RlmD [Terracidiphilus sp.]|nr:23S rRNA (uracil(1939)-C(5))-methyltransferase RlmD [Terracidiphilus sp.]
MNDRSDQFVRIEKPVYGGDFLARAEGKAIFVPLALPGEAARVRVVGEKSGYANAEIERIEEAASCRVMPRCAHFGTCGGCQYQHTDEATQIEFKRAILREALERGGVRVEDEIGVLAGAPWGYRNRIRLTFDAQGRLGYRGRRSHNVVPITECPIAAPVLMEAAAIFAECAQAWKQKPTEVTLFCNADETALLMSAVFARAPKLDVNTLGHEMAARVPALKGIDLLVAARGNAMPHAVARWGETSLTYDAAGFAYRVDHGAFFQVNRFLIDRFVQQVTAGYAGRLAWDLFAGVGLFARQLTAGFERVVAVESAGASTQALAANLKFTRSTPVRAATLDFLRRNHGDARPDFVVVDPPRNGLGAEVVSQLVEVAPADVVYVSCDPATLARDLSVLLKNGYRLHAVTLVDLFPQTFHLETVVQLKRA